MIRKVRRVEASSMSNVLCQLIYSYVVKMIQINRVVYMCEYDSLYEQMLNVIQKYFVEQLCNAL